MQALTIGTQVKRLDNEGRTGTIVEQDGERSRVHWTYAPVYHYSTGRANNRYDVRGGGYALNVKTWVKTSTIAAV